MGFFLVGQCPSILKYIAQNWAQTPAAFCVCVFVAQSCLILCYPMESNPPGSSVHGILWARTLEWVAMPFILTIGKIEWESYSSFGSPSRPFPHVELGVNTSCLCRFPSLFQTLAANSAVPQNCVFPSTFST